MRKKIQNLIQISGFVFIFCSHVVPVEQAGSNRSWKFEITYIFVLNIHIKWAFKLKIEKHNIIIIKHNKHNE